MLLILSLLVCGLVSLSRAEVTSHIIGGEEVTHGEHPYICSLQYRVGEVEGQDQWAHVCGCVIYSQRYIATAAHCVDWAEASAFRVQCGIHRLDGPDPGEVTRYVAEITVHEDFMSGQGAFPNDIAVLQLDTPLQWTDKVQMLRFADSSDGLFARRKCVLSGWGLTYGHGSALPNALRSVEVRALTNGRCDFLFSMNGAIAEGHVCVSGWGKGACNGDSGGPMHCGDVIVGLTSWGSGDCSTFSPSVYTRVSTHHDWLVSHTGGQH